jgi:hypothetical protein
MAFGAPCRHPQRRHQRWVNQSNDAEFFKLIRETLDDLKLVTSTTTTPPLAERVRLTPRRSAAVFRSERLGADMPHLLATLIVTPGEQSGRCDRADRWAA